MDRVSKVEYTDAFRKDYPYVHDNHNYFMSYWMYPFIDTIYNSRREAYDAIDRFINKVKTEFKHDYENYIIPNIRRDWFYISDYNDDDDDYYY